MIFVHELDTKAERYKEIITLNPWFALYKAMETAHDDNRFVLIRTTGCYYDILEKEERILRRLFDKIKNGEEQSIVIAEGDIDKNLKDFCSELYQDEWCFESKSLEYDRDCPIGKHVVVWYRQDPTDPTGHIFHFGVFEKIYNLLEKKQWEGATAFKKALMTIDKKTLKDFVEKLM